MSRQIALDNINLKPTSRWGHTEYSLEYHRDYLARRLNTKPDDPDLLTKTYQKYQFDFIFSVNDGLIPWERGRVTDMGHAVYAADSSDQRQPSECPFECDADVWSFDAVEEYGLPSMAEQVKAYEAQVQDSRRMRPDQSRAATTRRLCRAPLRHSDGTCCSQPPLSPPGWSRCSTASSAARSFT